MHLSVFIFSFNFLLYVDDVAMESAVVNDSLPTSTRSTSSKSNNTTTKARSKVKKESPEWFRHWLKRDEEKEMRIQKRHEEIMEIRQESLNLLKKFANKERDKNNS